MKKISLILVALCCSIFSFAEWKVETSKEWFFYPADQYIFLSDFAFNPYTGVVALNDNYLPTEEIDRYYLLYAHKRYDNSVFFKAQYKTDASDRNVSDYWTKESYNYGRKGGGECGYKSDCIAKNVVTPYGFMNAVEIQQGFVKVPFLHVSNSKGGRVSGTVEVDERYGKVTGLLYDMYASGHTAFRIFVHPFEKYRNEYMGYERLYDTPDGMFEYNFWMFQYFDVDIPSARVVDTLWNAIETHNLPVEIHYDEPYKCPVLIQAGNDVTYTWQFRHKDTENWKSMKPQTIKASEAKKGYFTDWNGSLDYQKGYDRLVLRLRLEVKKSADKTDTLFVNLPTALFQYPTISESDFAETVTWWNVVGAELNLSTNWACKKYTFYTEDGTPFRVIEDGTHLTALQPACVFHADLRDAKYDVNFYDFDGTLLKHQSVACEASATAPATPTHAGYEFKGWSQTFTNVHSDLDVYAQFDGFSSFGTFTLEQTEHISQYADIAGSTTRIAYDDYINYSINVKAISVVSVWMQRSLDGGNTWITQGGITTISAENASKENGYDFTTQLHLQDNIGQQSVGFRLCLKCNDTEVYTNAIFYDMCYPIIITPNAKYDETLIVSNSERSDLITMATGTDTLMTLVGDTVWFREATGNDAALVLNEKRTQITKQAETNYNYLICNNDNAISYSLLTHTVWYEVLGINSKAEYGINNIFAKEEVAHGKAATMDKIPVDPFDTEGTTHFAFWRDENTGEQANLSEVTDDLWLMAEFEDNYVPDTFTVTFKDWDGKVLGTQRVAEGSEADMFAYFPAREGYEFYGWDVDLSSITKDITATAQYAEFEGKYSILVTTNDFKMGIVTGVNQYKENESATIHAFPWDGYVFVKWTLYNAETTEWDDVSTSAEYTFTVTRSMSFRAVFTSATGWEDIESTHSDNQAQKIILDGVLHILRDGRVYNAQGQSVAL